MKDVIEVIYERKVHEKWWNLPFLGKFRRPVPVQPSRTEPVLVQVRVVPVQMALAAPVFVIFAYLS